MLSLDKESLASRIANLPPEKRALLELKLRQSKVAAPSADSALEQTISRRSTGNRAPLSFAQERIWFLDQLEPGNSFYNLPRCLYLEGSVNVEALEKALGKIVERHEALRTTIRVTDGDPVQVIGEIKPFSLSVIDRSERSASQLHETLENQILAILDDEIKHPFDLSRDSMLRATLFRLAPAEHVLLLVTHHIASDGWSSRLLLQELAPLYKSVVNGEPETLPELPIQYADFAIWQRERLSGTRLERQVSYWKNQLSGVSVLQLPVDRPRPAVQTYRGADQSVKLPRSLSDQLEALSRDAGVTLFMTLLAAFQTLLHRYSGQEDIAVGSPIAGRVRSETEPLIGMFINMLVLRSDLSGNPGFSELLDRVRRMALRAYEHQDLPFEKLVEELHPTRDRSRSPLFQVMFAYQNHPRQTFELPGLRSSHIETHSHTSNFDLSLYASNQTEGLTATLEYNSDLFDAATIQRMLVHFETLLRSIVATPTLRIADLPILTEAERHQLLVEWNNSGAAYPNDKRIHELFEAQVKQSPAGVAVTFEDRQLTYGELNAKSNQLACHLRQLEVGPDVLVGICLERSLEMIVGLLGILKAGGAYVPLDPAYPKDRLEFILKNSQVAVLLTQQSLLSLFDQDAHVVCMDRDWETIAQQGTQNLGIQGSSENLFNVIYTSGSTGRPKGVQIPHRAAANFLCAMQNQHRLDEKSVLLGVTTLSFDIAGLEIYLPLIAGARLVLVSHETAMDGAELIQKLHVSGANLMQATPATWQLLVESGWQGSNHLKVLCGGESLSRELANQLLTRCSSLWNMYGPTETTIWSTTHLVSKGEGTIPVGRPIDNTQVYILNASLQPVPIGVSGELYIGGAGVARGYLNLSELTAEKFVPDPFSPDQGARLYKSGDVARYLPDGTIDLLGRMDHQVKIRGFRIELGEIEAVLTQCPGVLQAVVVAREDIPGEKRLVAYVTSKPERYLTTPGVTGFLKTKLPDYMTPSALVFLDELPLTPNGKIDRRALPIPDSSRFTKEAGFTAPRNHLERQIANIWEKVLNIQPIGVTDNFFDLGGYSLRAVRVMSQMEKVFGRKLPVTALFQLPTVEQLARLLLQEVPLEPWSSLVPLQPNGSKPPFFWIHGEASDAFLPRYLGANQPLYGVLHQGNEGTPARYTRVDDIAAHYLSEIRTVQAKGPYYLGGYCFGGMLAFEIAQQLKKQNEQVELLFLLAPSTSRNDRLLDRPAENAESLRREVSRHLRSVEPLRAPGKMHYFLERVKCKMADSLAKVITPVRKLAETTLCQVYVRLGILLPPSLRSPYMLKIYFKAIEEYEPQVYSGRVVIFSATPKWKTIVTDGLEIHEVSGSHTDILKEPHARTWAARLKSHLEDAQAAQHAEIHEDTRHPSAS